MIAPPSFVSGKSGKGLKMTSPTFFTSPFVAQNKRWTKKKVSEHSTRNKEIDHICSPPQVLGQQVLLLHVHIFAVRYDVSEAFTDEHLETIQGTRAIANTGTRIKEPKKTTSSTHKALCNGLRNCAALCVILLHFLLHSQLCSSTVLWQGANNKLVSPIPLTCCTVLRLRKVENEIMYLSATNMPIFLDEDRHCCLKILISDWRRSLVNKSFTCKLQLLYSLGLSLTISDLCN